MIKYSKIKIRELPEHLIIMLLILFAPVTGSRLLADTVWPEPLRVFRGGAHISSNLISRDGRLAIIGSRFPASLQVRDINNGRKKWSYKQKGDFANVMALSPVKAILVTGGRDKIVRVWNLENGKKLHQLKGFRHEIRDLDFSSDGKYLSVLSGKKLHKIRTENYSRTSTRKIWAGSIAIQPNGNIIAAAAAGLRLHEQNTQKPKHRLLYGELSVDVKFSPDGRLLYLITWKKRLHIIDANLGLRLAIIDVPYRPARYTALSISPDGKLVALGDKHGMIRILNPATEALWGPFPAVTAEKGVKALAWHPDGKKILSGGGNTVKLWRLKDLRKPLVKPIRRAHVPESRHMYLNKNQNEIMLLGSHGKNHWFKFQGDKKITPLPNKGTGINLPGDLKSALTKENSRVFFNNGKPPLLALWRRKKNSSIRYISIYNSTNGSVLHELTTRDPTYSGITFHPNSRQLYTAKGRTIHKWDLRTNPAESKPRNFRGHLEELTQLQISPSGKKLASGAKNEIQVRHIDTQNVQKFTGSWKDIKYFAFNQTETMLAAAGYAKQVYLFDLKKGRRKKTMTFRSYPLSLSFSKNGRVFVVGLMNGWIHIYDANTFKKTHTFFGHNTGVVQTIITRNGASLLSKDAYGQVYEWRLD